MQFLSKVVTGEGNLKIAVTSKRIYFRVDEYDISSVLIEGNFPDYNKILPKECEARLILSREEFYEAVYRISIMTEHDSKICTLTVRGDNTLLLSARGNETGSAEEEIIYEGEGQKEITLVLTSQHLLEPLRQIKNSKVILEYSTPKQPVKLLADGEDHFFHIFMALSQDDNVQNNSSDE